MTDRRTKAGWSQQALADRLGYDVTYIGQIERAEKSPTLGTLISLATAFDVEISALLKAAEERLAGIQKQRESALR